MRKLPIILIPILFIILVGLIVFKYLNINIKISLPTPTPSQQLVGNDKDEHGCIPSAGYSWCEVKKKCIRTWEESCTEEPDQENLKITIKNALIAKHGSSANDLNITISKINGNYAQGGASSEGGGGMWFAVKDAGGWKLIWDGNGQINCSAIADFPEFPSSMIPECWDENTNKLITR